MSVHRSMPQVKLIIALWLLLLLLPCVQAAAFTFAWLSDTHIGSGTGEEDLRAAVNDINAMTNLSFVLHTGDVTEWGSLEQLRLAKKLLDEIKIPCHVVPGNHDTKWSESGATDFPRLWGAERIEFESDGLRFIGIHEGPLMKMGDGHWSPQDVRWLAERLKALPDQNQPLIFVTHYPIDDQIANWYVVLDLLKKYNIQAVLCGHGHRNRKLSFEGVPAAMGRSNLRAGGPAGGFNVVEVKDGVMSIAEHRNGGTTMPPWHSIVLCKHDYLAATNHYPLPDFSINSKYPAIKALWTFNTGWTIAGSPAIYKDLAIIGDASGTVYGLDLSSGRPRWRFEARGPVFSTPAVSGDIVVTPSTDGNVYSLEASTGKRLWMHPTTRPIVASPAVDAERVYVGSSEGKFRALNLATGDLVWEFDGVRGFIETRPLLHDGKVIFGAWDEHLYALDASTGKLAWKWHGDHPGTLYSPAGCWPVAANGKIFVAAPDRQMTAIAAKTGEQVWRTGAPQYVVRETIGLAEDNSRVYARAMNDFFFAFSTAAAQPELVWKLDAHFGYDINSAMMVEKEGVVFYGTKNGLIFALDARTGAIRWEHKIGVGIVNTLVPLSRSRVLTTDADGQVSTVGE